MPDLARRIQRQQAFLSRRGAGDLLVYVDRWNRYANLESYLCGILCETSVDEILSEGRVDPLIREYVRRLRDSCRTLDAIPDDLVPCANVYWGIGGITAAMTGLDPMHDATTSWLEPNLSWEAIDGLAFDADSKWLGLALEVNRALWRYWSEDFLILPYLHRSPLDAASGIRGSELYAEMYTRPDRVKDLVGWCASWSVQTEATIRENVDRSEGWGNGIWGTWLPDRAVFVNGDPVGLISREMQPEFDRPFTGELFTAAGGGFFHHHTVGLHQADTVAKTAGLLIQQFTEDPRCPSLPSVLLGNPEMRQTLIEASLTAPIMVDRIAPEQLDAILPIVREGRFILCVNCDETAEPVAIVRKVQSFSNLN